MKKTLVLAAACLFLASFAQAQKCEGETAFKKGKNCVKAEKTEKAKCTNCDAFKVTEPCAKAKHARKAQCNNCNPWKHVEPCKPVPAKPIMKPAPVPAPKPQPQRIKSEDLANVAVVSDRGGRQQITFTTPILFETNSDKLKTESHDPINKISAVLKKYPNAHTTVEGYTDSIGDPAYNVDLSERRAKTVAAQLVQNGVKEENVSAKGYGAASPIADNKTRDGRAKNRRVELNIENK